jgi:predicted ATPase
MIPRIRQVQIQNYRSFERAVVDLEPFTVLVGPNGAGKSNFIDALAFVQECVSQSIEAAWGRHGGAEIPTRQQENSVPVGFRLLFDLSERIRVDYAFEILIQGVALTVNHERCVIHGSEAGTTAYEVAQGRFVQEIPGIRPLLSADRLALSAASAAPEFRPVYEFLASIRRYSIDPLQLRQWQKLDSGEVLKPDGSNAASVLSHLYKLSKQDQDEEDRYRRLCSLLAHVVPGLLAVEPVSDGRGSDVILQFLQKLEGYEPETFSSQVMSDGTLRTLGLLLALYQPHHPSVLLIEEPEASIHPAMAEVLTEVLLDAAYDQQVLITTHSPDLLDLKELSSQQIRVVSRGRGRTVIAPMSQGSREAVVDRLYTPGELLRINELDQDVAEGDRAAGRLDLFGDAPLS